MGIALAITQASGVVTTYCTILDIRWQPGKSADLQIGYFLSKAAVLAGASPVLTSYFALDISLIDPTLPIPAQLAAQLLVGPLAGGMIC